MISKFEGPSVFPVELYQEFSLQQKELTADLLCKERNGGTVSCETSQDYRVKC